MTDIQFQVIAWEPEDVTVAEESNVCEKVPVTVGSRYVIRAFGRTADGLSVALAIHNFCPFFYVRVDRRANASDCEAVAAAISSLCSKRSCDDSQHVCVVTCSAAIDVWGYQAGRHSWFLKVSFYQWRAMQRAVREFDTIVSGVNFLRGSRLYEANLEPHLRFMHVADIPSAGWIRAHECEEIDGPRCDVCLECDWRNVAACPADQQNKRAPIRIAAFDIECHSRTGRFPVASKNYFDVAQSILDDARKCTRSNGRLSEAIIRRTVVSQRMPADAVSKIVQRICGVVTGRMLFDSNAVNLIASAFSQNCEEPGDPIVQIGTTIHKYGDTEPYSKHIVTVGDCDRLDGEGSDVTVWRVSDEKQLLSKWIDWMSKMDPDIVTGYNIFGFDFKYIVQRAMKLGMYPTLTDSGLARFGKCAFVRKVLSSSALGDNEMYFLEMPGRTCFDLMKIVQRDHKLDSYKLDNVGEVFLGERKHDVTPNEIFAAWNNMNGDRARSERARVASYCVQDCALCNRLVCRLDVIPNTLAMATVCFVPIKYIFLRGQGVKIFSLVLQRSSKCGMRFPTITAMNGTATDENATLQNMTYAQYATPALRNGHLAPNASSVYDGATVLTPVPGIYDEYPVAVLDYASLYPSSMISENISHDTLIMDSDFDKNIEDDDCNIVTYREGEADITCRFVKTPEGILPQILRYLLDARKETRARAKHKKTINLATQEVRIGNGSTLLSDAEAASGEWSPLEDAYDAFEKKVLDGMQLAYKLTANSLYGQMGAVTSPVYLKALAACTTATGRNLIHKAKTFMEKEEGAHVIYGDSVAEYTPLVLLNESTGEVIVTDVGDFVRRLGASWRFCSDDLRREKEFINVTGWSSWTECGWSPIRRIIRHVLNPLSSHLVRVITTTGLVDVTSHHSLLRSDGTEVKPENVATGDVLCHADLPLAHCGGTDKLTEDEARILGMFMCYNSDVVHWKLWAVDFETVVECRSICERLYGDMKWIVSSDHYCGYRLYPASLDSNAVRLLAIRYQTLFRLRGENIRSVPFEVLNASENVRRAFWYGMLACLHSNSKSKIVKVVMPTHLAAASVFQLTASLKLPTSIMARSLLQTRSVMLQINTATTYVQRSDVVRSKYPVPYRGYVYDLTTDNHHFAAGVGRMIVHNTDSVMVMFPVARDSKEKMLRESIDRAVSASKAFKRLLKPPHDLEYEKTFFPYIIFSKKRYVGNKYEFDVNKYSQASMGIVLKRRDNAPIVKDVYGGALDMILNGCGIVSAAEKTKEFVRDILGGIYPLEKFVVTKTLKMTYKAPQTIAHKVLADRVAKREPGNAFQVNDRVPYVHVVNRTARLMGDCVETPEFVVANSASIDYLYYVQNQIMKPVCQLFALRIEALPGFCSMRPPDYYDGLRRSGSSEEAITIAKEKDASVLLFGNVLRDATNKRANQYPITDFFGSSKKRG